MSWSHIAQYRVSQAEASGTCRMLMWHVFGTEWGTGFIPFDPIEAV